MRDEEFQELVNEMIGRGHELRNIECKGPGIRNDKNFFTKIVRACIGMSNRRDGGFVIIGLSETDGSIEPNGLNDTQLKSWKYDSIGDSLAVYCDPPIQFEVEFYKYQNHSMVLIMVNEFEDMPIICKKDYENNLRSGACYVRTRRKPETTEIPTQNEMRELLDLALEKRLRTFHIQYLAMTQGTIDSRTPNDKELFEKQLEGLI